MYISKRFIFILYSVEISKNTIYGHLITPKNVRMRLDVCPSRDIICAAIAKRVYVKNLPPYFKTIHIYTRRTERITAINYGRLLVFE